MSSPLRVLAIIAVQNEADIIGQTIEDLVAQGIPRVAAGSCVVRWNGRRSSGYLAMGPPPASSRSPPVDAAPEDARSVRAGGHYRQKGAGRASWMGLVHYPRRRRVQGEPVVAFEPPSGHPARHRLGFNAIDFQVLNFWPTHHASRPAVDVREAFRHYAARRSVGSAAGQVLEEHRSSGGAREHCGARSPIDGRRIFPIRFRLRHYRSEPGTWSSQGVRASVCLGLRQRNALADGTCSTTVWRKTTASSATLPLSACTSPRSSEWMELRHPDYEELERESEEQSLALRERLDNEPRLRLSRRTPVRSGGVRARVAERDALRVALEKQQSKRRFPARGHNRHGSWRSSKHLSSSSGSRAHRMSSAGTGASARGVGRGAPSRAAGGGT